MPAMENSSIVWSNITNTVIVHSDASHKNNDVVKIEKAVFLTCICLVSFLAIPPNVLLLYLSLKTSRGRCGKRNSLSQSSDRINNRPVLLISQLVSNLSITATSPLDITFIVRGTEDGVVCVTFLSVKSVFMLFSMLVVFLQGLDKLYKVRNLHQLHLNSRAGTKLLAIVASLVISTIPLMLELILTRGHPLEDGCRVLPVTVDVTEIIFFSGFFLSCASLLIVVFMLRKHSRRVSADGGDVGLGSSRALSSPRLPSVSQVVSEVVKNQGEEGGTDTTQAAVTSNADKDSSTRKQTTPTTLSVIPRSLSNEENKSSNRPAPVPVLVSVPVPVPVSVPVPVPVSVPAISLQRSPTPRKTSVGPGTCESGQLLSPVEHQYFFQPDFAVSHNGQSVTSPVRSSSMPAVHRASKGSVRWSVPGQNEDTGRGSETFCRQVSTLTTTDVRSRSMSTSSATQRRLEFATVTAAKRGALSMVIFLLCYLPLMVTLLILSEDNPMYETALLLEGLTLPISYVHSLLNPILVMKIDQERREQASALIRRWCKCCSKNQSR